jgi:hypothetical protein
MARANQRRAYDFLAARAGGEAFALAALAEAAGWKAATARSNAGKHYRGWVEVLPGSNARVLAEFRRVTFEQFVRHSSQVRPVHTQYETIRYTGIARFEFLLPSPGRHS